MKYSLPVNERGWPLPPRARLVDARLVRPELPAWENEALLFADCRFSQLADLCSSEAPPPACTTTIFVVSGLMVIPVPHTHTYTHERRLNYARSTPHVHMSRRQSGPAWLAELSSWEPRLKLPLSPHRRQPQGVNEREAGGGTPLFEEGNGRRRPSASGAIRRLSWHPPASFRRRKERHTCCERERALAPSPPICGGDKDEQSWERIHHSQR